MNKRRAAFEQRTRKPYKRLERDPLARYNRMSTDQDWTNVWPTSSMFKQSSVPLPVRQGFIKKLTETKKPSFETHASTSKEMTLINKSKSLADLEEKQLDE